MSNLLVNFIETFDTRGWRTANEFPTDPYTIQRMAFHLGFRPTQRTLKDDEIAVYIPTSTKTSPIRKAKHASTEDQWYCSQFIYMPEREEQVFHVNEYNAWSAIVNDRSKRRALKILTRWSELNPNRKPHTSEPKGDMVPAIESEENARLIEEAMKAMEFRKHKTRFKTSHAQEFEAVEQEDLNNIPELGFEQLALDPETKPEAKPKDLAFDPTLGTITITVRLGQSVEVDVSSLPGNVTVLFVSK
jgi:hypothetical protein